MVLEENERMAEKAVVNIVEHESINERAVEPEPTTSDTVETVSEETRAEEETTTKASQKKSKAKKSV